MLGPQEVREIVYSILSNDQRQKLETDWQIDLAYSIPGKARFRVNAYFQRASIGAAFRLIPQEMPALDDARPAVASCATSPSKPRGFVLVTGPTGSGKSTTLAAMIDVINEDAQRAHPHDRGPDRVPAPAQELHRQPARARRRRADASRLALKAALRQDPDVILVGEMRDLETISTALTAAETGHLVFATLHTQDTAQTVDRIVDVFPPEQQHQVRVQLSVALQGIVTQQLLPTADGQGRVVASEVLVPTPAVRNLIREGKTHQIHSTLQTGGSHGMQTMDASLAELVRRRQDHARAGRERARPRPRSCGASWAPSGWPRPWPPSPSRRSTWPESPTSGEIEAEDKQAVSLAAARQAA